MDDDRVTVGGFTVRSPGAFGVDADLGAARYFHGTQSTPSLVVTRSPGRQMDVDIVGWSDDPANSRRWTVAETGDGTGGVLEQQVRSLAPNADHHLRRNGGAPEVVRTDGEGVLFIRGDSPLARPVTFDLLRVSTGGARMILRADPMPPLAKVSID
jgi:hypothetical protein